MPETLKLVPQVGQSRLSGAEGQVLSHALGHHAVPPVLAQENRTESALGDVLLVGFQAMEAMGEGGGA